MAVEKIESPISSIELIGKTNEIIDNLKSSLETLSDVTIASASSGQVLSYDGSDWVNSNPTTVTFRNWS